jgi:sugar phosphate isomerase/epimerase
MKTRREFIKTTSLLIAGSALLQACPSSIFKPIEKLVGIQLYTLRHTIPDKLVDTLRKLSKIGYTSIESYGFNGKFHGYPPKEFRQIIEDLGMKLTSTHSGINLDNAKEYMDAAAEAGLEYVILPSFHGRPDKTTDDFKRAAEEMNKIGEIANEARIRFGYHNHDFEFVKTENGYLYDILVEETEPELVCFQLDIGWLAISENDAGEYFKKFPGRFESWHVKDIDAEGKTTFVGNGVIDYEKIFKLAELSGMKRFYVEQERFDAKPIEEVTQSYQHIKKILDQD